MARNRKSSAIDSVIDSAMILPLWVSILIAMMTFVGFHVHAGDKPPVLTNGESSSIADFACKTLPVMASSCCLCFFICSLHALYRTTQTGQGVAGGPWA